MLHKLSYKGKQQYSIDESEKTLDVTSLRQVLVDTFKLSNEQVNNTLDKLEVEGSLSLDEKTGHVGVVVDMYEVDYPEPSDPMKQTQELASHLDEEKDFVTQYLFPGSTVEDIVVDLASDIENKRKMKSNHTQTLKTMQQMQQTTSKKDWREIL